MGKRALVGLLAAVLWVAGGCGRQKSKVVARVNERPITKEQLWETLERGENGEAGRRALDALIVRQLVRQEAQKRGIKVSPEEVQVRLEGLKDYVLAGAGKDFASWLEDTGLTEEYLSDRLSLQILTSKLVIPDRDRKEYFETNKERLKELPHNNESVIYRQVIVATKPEAEALHKELATSETADFAKIAGDKSLDPMTRSRGGMMGWAVKGKMSPSDQELEKVLFSLKSGEISRCRCGLRQRLPQAEARESSSRRCGAS